MHQTLFALQSQKAIGHEHEELHHAHQSHHINHEETPLLPPDFNDAQSLTSDEILDILLCGTSKS